MKRVLGGLIVGSAAGALVVPFVIGVVASLDPGTITASTFEVGVYAGAIVGGMLGAVSAL